MGRTPTDSLHFRLKGSGSTSRINNPSSSISESRTDVQLPQELVTEILLRLPVKSLLKFKCVSKPWLRLISSPQFIRSHFSISSMEVEYLNLQLLFNAMTSMKQCSLYSALREAEPSTHVPDVGFPPKSECCSSMIVGIVNGLVCLDLSVTDLFIWNPILKKVKDCGNIIPKAPFTSLRYTCGFGYNESIDDYKVFCLLRKYGAQGDIEDEVKAYSLRADSWKVIDKLKGFDPTCDPGIYANGKIYWSGYISSTRRRKIVSLDMLSEKYGEPQYPNYEAGEYDLKLGVLGGRMCVLCDYARKADLWVMDKYGDEESWCKVVSIPYVADVDLQMLHNSLHRFLCILSNGEIVLAKRFGLLVYNSKKKEFREIELDVGIYTYGDVAAYVESLVWPYA